MFLIYINDLQECIIDSTISSFADDTRMKKKILMVSDVNVLQSNLGRAEGWSSDNNMSLHDKKFELLCHSLHKPNQIAELPFHQQYFECTTQSGVVIHPQPIVRDLGVNIAADLSWTPHINSIADSARKMSAWSLSVFSDRSEESMMTIYKSMIRSRAEYCSPLWNPRKITDIQTIEQIQRSFTAKVKECSDLKYHDRP